MTALNFGVGLAIGRRTDIVNPTPSFMGILQDIEIDFDQTIKELYGSQKFPVDVAQAQVKITGKAKFARIGSSIVRDLFFGPSVVTTPAAGFDMANAEAAAVPGTPYKITVAQAATFKEDQGVFYAATFIQLQRVAAGAEALGKYSVNESTGVYTFAAAETLANLLFFYVFGVTNLYQSVISNTQMGTGSAFKLQASETYVNNAGTTSKLNIALNACRATKLSLPFKNADYTVQGFDFTVFADQAGNVGTISTTE